jgi:hypothetical protein
MTNCNDCLSGSTWERAPIIEINFLPDSVGPETTQYLFLIIYGIAYCWRFFGRLKPYSK